MHGPPQTSPRSVWAPPAGPPALRFIAGEPSGDLHAAGLIEELRKAVPGIRLSGLGGPRMERAGMRLDADLASDAIMGIFPVIKALPRIRRMLALAKQKLAEERPDALVLVDYPGFNMRLARAAKDLGVPVIYYISPQVWAWGADRVEKLARLVDLMLVILPFEEEVFAKHGLRTVFTGHPVLEHVARSAPDERLIADLRSRRGEGPLVGVFPGSRRHVVRSLVSQLLDAGRQLRQLPGTGGARFVIALAQPSYRDLVPAAPDLPLELVDGHALDVMRASDVCLTTSGSTTLEIAAVGRPFVLTYRPSLPLYAIARRILRVPHIGLVNLVAGRPVVPEHVHWRSQAEPIARDLNRLWVDAGAREEQLAGLAGVRARLETSGAYAKAARSIAEWLAERRP
jgi:lipid-A-disaccharide synthase